MAFKKQYKQLCYMVVGTDHQLFCAVVFFAVLLHLLVAWLTVGWK